MKPTKTKQQQRKELDKQIEDYLRSGGSVNSVAQGISGNDSNLNLFKQTSNPGPKQERTPLDDVVKEIEARKSSKKETKPKKRTRRKVAIVDDFGEPIRWVWEE